MPESGPKNVTFLCFFKFFCSNSLPLYCTFIINAVQDWSIKFINENNRRKKRFKEQRRQTIKNMKHYNCKANGQNPVNPVSYATRQPRPRREASNADETDLPPDVPSGHETGMQLLGGKKNEEEQISFTLMTYAMLPAQTASSHICPQPAA